MCHINCKVPEAYRITQASGLKLKERVGVVDPATKKHERKWPRASVISLSGDDATITFCCGDEMVSEVVKKDILYAMTVAESLFDGITSDEIMAFRKKPIAA